MRKTPFLQRNDFWVAKEGYPFIGPAAIVFLSALALKGLGVFSLFSGIILTYFILFFRNPQRLIPEAPGLVVAPADGRIVEIGEVYEERFLKEKVLKISIFMNLFNVHVNRFPVRGQVQEISYNPGKFISAAREKASLENEQNALILETPKGTKLLMIQIAGLIARRIVCWAKPGEIYQRGERFGVIRFGSRVDLFLPLNAKPRVQAGQKVKGGETVLGVMHEGS